MQNVKSNSERFAQHIANSERFARDCEEMKRATHHARAARTAREQVQIKMRERTANR